ncbi:KH domain-containing, RNA-binding, signal transduction-associated protein 2-like [Oscarella lobularis]|uniref:KH domain-containing, RNA-binding, signal transduction-associated protein 2-like n=1 Tax=Oscarella lobularis TaxID=121494 RepID=UPI003313AB4A
MTDESAAQAIETNASANYVEQLTHEKASLGAEFIHAARLLQQEIDRVEGRGPGLEGGQAAELVRLTEKVVIPEKDHPGFNFVGRLLGPRGYTLKRMQTETGCRMTILGRGSMRDKEEEDKLRSSGNAKYEHLNEDLHVFVEAEGPRAIADAKLAAGVAELRKMMIPGPMAEQMKNMQLRELAMLKGNIREPRIGPPGIGALVRPPIRRRPPARRSLPSMSGNGTATNDDVFLEGDVSKFKFSYDVEDWTNDVATPLPSQGLKIPVQQIQPRKSFRDHPYAY